MTYIAKNISISINLGPSEVYDFLSDPTNLPKWAAGLANSELRMIDDYWVTSSPMGEVKITFAPKNEFGVIDHDVYLPSGEINHNPLRVVKNGEGSEVIFTLYHLPRMNQNDFENDAQLVQKDLMKLKTILEWRR